jgi:serine phosphatase RsbU (regulator of sigma subunit)
MVEQLESSQNELKQKNDVIEKNVKMLHEKNEKITIQRDKIEVQRDEIEAQRDLVTKQKDKILEHKQSITDSIQYASRIQTAILPPDEVIKYLLPKHFILYKPRDIVSGDFYWLTHRQGEIIIVVADCTGHGVPGAFMSMLGSAFLKDVVNSSNILQANQILNDLREKIILSLRQTGQTGEAKDGMDISLCIINTERMRLQYAGAYQPLFLIRKGTLKEIKADKMPIGISSKAGKSFTNNEIKIFKNDSLYLFSDGYVDQFGGENGKKFLSIRFKQLLIDIQDNIMFDQKELLDQNINEWMGLTGLYKKYDQIDDITVLGIKI